jgi:uncharacterized membrane protein HdeD (DUF308 family)
MKKSATLSSASQIKQNIPLPVKIISWLMLISGILGLFGVLPLLFLGGFGKSGTVFFMGLLNLVMGIGNVVISFGLRSMRKWSLYAFTILTIIAAIIAIYSYISSPRQGGSLLGSLAIQVLILIYLWSISRKFARSS